MGKNRNIATAKCNIGSESLNSAPIISIVLFGFALFYFADTGSHSAVKTSLKYCGSQAGLEFTAVLLLQPPAEILSVRHHLVCLNIDRIWHVWWMGRAYNPSPWDKVT